MPSPRRSRPPTSASSPRPPSPRPAHNRPPLHSRAHLPSTPARSTRRHRAPTIANAASGSPPFTRHATVEGTTATSPPATVPDTSGRRETSPIGPRDAGTSLQFTRSIPPRASTRSPASPTTRSRITPRPRAADGPPDSSTRTSTTSPARAGPSNHASGRTRIRSPSPSGCATPSMDPTSEHPSDNAPSARATPARAAARHLHPSRACDAAFHAFAPAAIPSPNAPHDGPIANATPIPHSAATPRARPASGHPSGARAAPPAPPGPRPTPRPAPPPPWARR